MTGPAATAASAYDSVIRGSELLAQVCGHRRVVAQRLVQVASVRPVVACSHLAERRAELATDPLCLGHQRSPDPPLAGSGVDHQGEDPDDPVVVLEAWHRVERDEAEHRSLVLGNDDLGMGGSEPLEPRDDVT